MISRRDKGNGGKQLQIGMMEFFPRKRCTRWDRVISLSSLLKFYTAFPGFLRESQITDLSHRVKATVTYAVAHGGFSDIYRGELEIVIVADGVKRTKTCLVSAVGSVLFIKFTHHLRQVAIKVLRALTNGRFDIERATKVSEGATCNPTTNHSKTSDSIAKYASGAVFPTLTSPSSSVSHIIWVVDQPYLCAGIKTELFWITFERTSEWTS